MGTNAEEALLDIVRATVGFLEHPEAPERVIGFGLLEDGTYEVCIYEGVAGTSEEVRIGARYVAGVPRAPHTGNATAVLECIKDCRTKHGVHEDFVYREVGVDGAYDFPSWTLVHPTTLFARYVGGTGVPLRRNYDG